MTMARILFTFLGTANYQPIRYRFEDRDPASEVTRFFPAALLEERRRGDGRKLPDRIVVCGTPTSGWQPLVEALDAPRAFPPRGEPPKLPALSDDVIEGFAAPLTARLGIPVVPKRIDFARNEVQQTVFVELVSGCVDRGDTVEFDITHGLRHLPLVALTAALALRTLRDATVEAIWYGAFEMKEPDLTITDEHDKVAPVIRLDGLLRIADWLGALTVFNATGDMARFGPLIQRETGAEVATGLAEASFRERVLHTGSIRETAAAMFDALEDADGGVSALVRPELQRRLAWALDPVNVDQGFDLAQQFARDGNEIRAITLAFETVVEKIATATGIRGLVKPKALTGVIGDAIRWDQSAFAKAYRELNEVRNTVAHPQDRDGSRAFSKVLGSAAAFRKEFDRMLVPLRKPVPPALAQAVRAAAKLPPTTGKP
jgi:CRISPR-associated Csx2 family protein